MSAPDFSSILQLSLIPVRPMIASEEVDLRVGEAFRTGCPGERIIPMLTNTPK
jgi:hypothetical protein